MRVREDFNTIIADKITFLAFLIIIGFLAFDISLLVDGLLHHT